MLDHERHYEPGSQRVNVDELGKAPCCGARMYATNVMQDGRIQQTRHCDHKPDCEVEYPPGRIAGQPQAKKAKRGR